MISILSWNIQQGGGSRVSLISKYLIQKSPDVIVLSEFKNNEAGNTIRRTLLRNLYIHQAVSHADGSKNSVCIASKFPFSSSIYFDIDPNYSHCLIKAQFQAFDVIGVYMPHKKKHRLFDHLIEQAYPHPTIICGDFNSGINGLDQKGNSFWYEDELFKLQEKGFQDAFRLLHRDVREYSWYSHQGNGYRYDHTYISKDLSDVASACYFDHEVRENKLSDHSPMYVLIG